MSELLKKSGTSIRNSNIEFLRIISMMFIVLSHVCVHSGFDVSVMTVQINKLFIRWGVLGNLGVDIFVMISGYFLCERNFGLKQLIRLWTQVWTYSTLILLGCGVFMEYPLSVKRIISAFLPTIFAEYWFFTAYIVLMLITPLLNEFIKYTSRSTYDKILLTLFVVWFAIPTISMQNMFSDEIPQFIFLYLLGAYFKKYPENLLNSPVLQKCLTIISFGVLFSSTVVMALIKENFISYQFYLRNSVVIIGCAVGLFAISVYSNPKHNKLVNLVGSCTFGIYLIHDNNIVRELLWTDWLSNINYVNSIMFIPRLIASVLIVFVVSLAIEFSRQKTIARPLENIVYNIVSYVIKKTNNMISKTKNSLKL